MSKDYVVIAHPEGGHFEEIRKAVQAVNGLQSYFKCNLVPEKDILSAKNKASSPNKLAKKILRKYGQKRIIAVTEQYYKTGYVIEERLPTISLVTCADWEEGEQPPLGLFLIYSITTALITFEAALTPTQSEDLSHREPIGCIFDWWTQPKDLRLDMVAARLCGDCRSAISSHLQDKDEVFRAIQSILDFVRRSFLGDAVVLPSKIWIIHGSSSDWQELAAMLKNWHLAVDEFNVMAVVGIPIVERWKQMASKARFAFALLTEDELLPANRKLPRLNVAHEIGLCHARLGIEGTFILRQGKTEVFSNLQGINYLQYKTGKLWNKEKDIRKLLEARGVL